MLRVPILTDFKKIVHHPIVKAGRRSVWAQYTIRVQNREYLRSKLKALGIPTAVHYPKPLHLQECLSYLGSKRGDYPISEQAAREVVSLPMNPFLSLDQIEYISTSVLEALR